jgi:hypothetical protein
MLHTHHHRLTSDDVSSGLSLTPPYSSTKVCSHATTSFVIQRLHDLMGGKGYVERVSGCSATDFWRVLRCCGQFSYLPPRMKFFTFMICVIPLHIEQRGINGNKSNLVFIVIITQCDAYDKINYNNL